MFLIFLKKLGNQLIEFVFIYPVIVYQKLVSPDHGWLGFIFNSALLSLNPGLKPGCPFKPTCSEYYIQVVQQHGLFNGLPIFFKRLSQCW